MGNISGGLSLILFLIPGFLLNNLILGKKRTWESIALSWITGSVLVTLAFYILNVYLGVKLNLTNSWLIFSSLTIILFIFNINNFSLPEKIILSKYEKLLLIIFAALLVLAFVTSFFFPVVDWDSITVFDFRAKPILEFGQIKNTLFSTNIASYPFYTTLLHFWVYLNGLWTAMPVYPLFTVSFAAGIYFAARRVMPSKISLLLAVACIFTPRIFPNSFIAYTNFPYTVLLILGAIYIYLWAKDKNYRDLILGIVFSAATFWVRSFPFALVNFSLLFLAVPFLNKISKYLAITSLIIAASLVFIPNFSDVTRYIGWSVYKYYSPFWIIFIGLFIYNLIKRKKNWFWVLLYIGYSLVLFLGTFILVRHNTSYYLGIPDAIQRMTIFFSAIIIWFLAESYD